MTVVDSRLADGRLSGSAVESLVLNNPRSRGGELESSGPRQESRASLVFGLVKPDRAGGSGV